MSPAAARPPKARLADEAEQSGRTSTMLIGSLAARLAVMPLVSGSSAVGSLVAGMCEVGREVSKTAEGARLRSALARGRAGTNGRILWDELKIKEWMASVPPAPVLDHLRNDFALLLADDLDVALSLQPVPNPTGTGPVPDEAYDVLDCMVGIWAFSTEVGQAVEALADLAGGVEADFTTATPRRLGSDDPDLLR